MKHLAIIPARSGSKGLIDKNIKLLNGKPLLAYSIEAAINSKVFDTIMVSTDSKIYAEIAQSYGAEVPFFRSDKTSGDNASSWDTVDEVLESYYNLAGKRFETVCLLQPTSPLRTSDDIKKAYDLFYMKDADSITSVCQVDHSPIWCNTLDDDLNMDNFITDEIKNKNRQMLSTYYRINGAIYIRKTENYITTQSKKMFAYIMDKKRSVDIDDEFDFMIANFLIMNEHML